ncbi:MAG: tol-pal system protein YbgF [Candidatus Zixiibacteriota bacterium]
MNSRNAILIGRSLLVLAVGALAMGCVSRAAIQKMGAQLDYLEASQKRMEKDIVRIDSLTAASAEASFQTRADVGTSLEEFRRDALAMREAIDDLRQQIDRRPAQVIYQPPASQPGDTGASATGAAGGAPDIDPSQLYENAFLDVRKGNYELAIAQFRDVLQFFGQTEYAPNARYWIGECWYSMEQYDSALVEFDQLVSTYPQSDRLPTALYKMGRCYEEKAQPRRAKTYYDRVIKEYPNSLEAKPAQSRLAQME